MSGHESAAFTCPRCGAVVAEDQRFCTSCGNQIAPTGRSSAPSKTARAISLWGIVLTAVNMLEPWWKLQSVVPAVARRILSFVFPALIGYYYGQRALGREWTTTLISISVATAVAFLIQFSPPAWMRRSDHGHRA